MPARQGDLIASSFESQSSTTGIIHNRKVESTEDLLPRKKFSCWRNHHHDEVSVDLPQLRTSMKVVDLCCNPLSVRYACRPIIRPWPAVLTVLGFAVMTYAFAFVFLVSFNKTIECKLTYPSIILDADTPEGGERLLMDRVSFPWVDIGEIDRTNTADIFRLDEVIFSPSSCGKNYEDFKSIDGELVMYYQLEPFFQNHRLYIFSRDQQQLHGKWRTPSEASYCTPMITLKDAKNYWGAVPTWWAPQPADLAPDEDVTLHPCGLQAISVFNDTYVPMDYDGVELGFYTGASYVTLKDDIEVFKNPTDPLPTNEEGKITSYLWMPSEIFPEQVEQPSFMNWMRLSNSTTARKLVGRFKDEELKFPFKVQVKNRYNVSHWSGSKSLVIVKQPHFGSVTEQMMTPFWLLATGTTILVLVFVAKLKIRPRLVGDIRLLHERKRLLH